MPYRRFIMAVALVLMVSVVGFACGGAAATATPEPWTTHSSDSGSYGVSGEPTPAPRNMSEPTTMPAEPLPETDNDSWQWSSSSYSVQPTTVPQITANLDRMDSGLAPTAIPSATTFQDYRRSPLVDTSHDRISTFSLDSDRTSFQLALNWAREGYLVDPDSVRAEEWVNAFHYDYQGPSREDSFAISSAMVEHPLRNGMHLARVTFQAPDIRDEDRPLNVTLVLDASGSMSDGNRVETARAAADAIRRSLGSSDLIAVVQFSDDVLHRYTVEHRRPNDRTVMDSIANLRPNHSTNVQAGLNLGVQMADRMRHERPDAHNYLILMSDGVANVDATDPFAILESAGDRRSDNPLRLITIGVGINNYNDYLLEQLAQHGNGWYRYLDDESQARATFRRENWTTISTPFADQTRAQVRWDPSAVESWRLIGYENRVTPDETFVQNRKEFAEIPSGAATTVFYEVQLAHPAEDWGGQPIRLGDVHLRWVTPISGETRQQDAEIRGHQNVRFEDPSDDMLRFGSIVALASDRYSGLPYAEAEWPPEVGKDLRALKGRLDSLRPGLSHLDSYNDFAFVLRHLVNTLPRHEGRSGGSGYSP